ncbi:hypothetical protein WMY93_018263 [Mugilogobius chulae]|uniref:Uncharacterized protein n=1 Tax=Mugilogobius chulae TaxID=88201 RepID=A0AAW0NVL8_9GOBI
MCVNLWPGLVWPGLALVPSLFLSSVQMRVNLWPGLVWPGLALVPGLFLSSVQMRVNLWPGLAWFLSAQPHTYIRAQEFSPETPEQRLVTQQEKNESGVEPGSPVGQSTDKLIELKGTLPLAQFVCGFLYLRGVSISHTTTHFSILVHTGPRVGLHRAPSTGHVQVWFGRLHVPECTSAACTSAFVDFGESGTKVNTDDGKHGSKAIIFDLDNTLIDTSGAGQVALQKVGELLKSTLNVDDATIETICNGFKQNLYNENFNSASGKTIDEVRTLHWEKSLRETVPRCPVESLGSDCYKLWKSSRLQLLTMSPEVQALLQDLRTKYKLLLLTNGETQTQREKVQVSNCDDFFDEVGGGRRAAGAEAVRVHLSLVF